MLEPTNYETDYSTVLSSSNSSSSSYNNSSSSSSGWVVVVDLVVVNLDLIWRAETVRVKVG